MALNNSYSPAVGDGGMESSQSSRARRNAHGAQTSLGNRVGSSKGLRRVVARSRGRQRHG
jgi:hypothetical protein